MSINQLINSAVAEKMATLMTVDYLEERGKSGSRKKFEAVLAKAPNREPEAFDRLPNMRLEQTSRKARGGAAKR